MTETVADQREEPDHRLRPLVGRSGERLALGVDDLGCREDGDEHEQAGDHRDDVGDERCPHEALNGCLAFRI